MLELWSGPELRGGGGGLGPWPPIKAYQQTLHILFLACDRFQRARDYDLIVRYALLIIVLVKFNSFTYTLLVAYSVFTARRYAKRGICRRRVSVCVSVTVRYCIKTAKLKITLIMPHNSPLTLVFWCQRSWLNLNRITPYGGDKCKWGGLKLATFDEKHAITRKRYKIDA